MTKVFAAHLRALWGVCARIFFALLVATPSFALDRDQWRRLLHFDGSKSRVDGPGFFLSEKGARDPEAELQATIQKFRSEPEARCRFPARFELLEKEFALMKVACPELDRFHQQMRAQSVSLVFSTAYSNNPGSMFGHTFLRFKTGGPALLDPTISYAAQVGDGVEPLYVLRGLFGGYRGVLSVVPYHMKVNEYVRSESRDLFEYELDLSEAERERLLDYFWEIQANAHLDYYFFDENCASLLLEALNVARPGLGLEVRGIHVTPGEAVRAVALAPGLVKRIDYRPSLKRRFEANLENLDERQIAEFEKVALRNDRPEATTDARVIETASLYADYVKDVARKERLLVRQSELPAASEIEIPAPPTRPELGHRPYRVEIAAVRGAETESEISFRPALHDLLDDDAGFSPHSQIEMASLALRVGKEFHLERATLASIVSLVPVSRYEKPLSWQLELDSRRLRECEDCQAAHARFGGGYAVAFNEQVAYAFVSGQAEVDRSLDRGHREGPVASLGAIAQLLPNWKLQLRAERWWIVTNELRDEVRVEQAVHLARAWDLRFAWTLVNAATDSGEAKLAIGHDF